MEIGYSEERELLAEGCGLPAAIAIATAYKASGSLSGDAKALEAELVSHFQERWNDYYESDGRRSLPDFESGGMATFARYNLVGIFPKEQKSLISETEMNTLLNQVGRSLRDALSTGRKPNENKLCKQILLGQRKAMARLICTLTPNDLEDRVARYFLRRRDIPVLQQIVRGSEGKARPLISYLEPEDWEVILHLWTRGWQPTAKAVETRIAARIDGVARGGALDQITSY